MPMLFYGRQNPITEPVVVNKYNNSRLFEQRIQDTTVIQDRLVDVNKYNRGIQTEPCIQYGSVKQGGTIHSLSKAFNNIKSCEQKKCYRTPIPLTRKNYLFLKSFGILK